MSDFWKKRRPQMTDEEERALWERVRTMPFEARGAARTRSPWAALWARPAVRFGAPVLAVALVAIVWVAQQSPEAPRPESDLGSTATREMEQTAPTGEDAATLQEAAPAPVPAPVPAPIAARDPRMAKDAPANLADETGSAAPTSSASPAEPGVVGGSRARRVEPEEAKEASGFAVPPAATSPAPTPAADDRKDEAARPSAKASASQPSVAGSAATERSSAGLQAMRVAPDPEALLASRERAIRRGDFASLVFDDVVRPEAGGPFGSVLKLPFSRDTVLLKRSARDGRWEVLEDPLMLEGSIPAPGALEQRSALAVELTRGIEARDVAAIERVGQAVRRLRAQDATDPGTRELQGWCEAAKRAIQSE